ncbi:histidine kinase dimerization/phosphoacceptor domain -containing protein [Spirochaeta lutea]|uniref:histidine kinase n=1 Tax=Spirochaeta lutea TaxID=1480694 RepID=A0A098QYZ6_9SPIO|nr:histidine kinase dimerization/phosphoacceptor domain -containing protein [Spirochaeta lutea]KGE71717.1 hypothetical protein DC28_10740 [Spirochaeta lutea]
MKNWRVHSRALGAGICLGVILGALLTLWTVTRIQDQRHIDQQRMVEARLSSLQVELDQYLSRLSLAVEGLADFAAHQQNRLSRENFEVAARVLHAGLPVLRNLYLAPAGVITHVYPHQGNETVLGLNLFADPRSAVREEVFMAQYSSGITVSGPLELFQGGQGLVFRRAVRDAQGDFWGFAGLVVDVDSMAGMPGLQTDPAIELGVKNEMGTLLWGSEGAFDEHALLRDVRLPDGEGWSVAAVYRPEQAMSSPGFPAARGAGVFFAALALVAAGVTGTAGLYRRAVMRAGAAGPGLLVDNRGCVLGPLPREWTGTDANHPLISLFPPGSVLGEPFGPGEGPGTGGSEDTGGQITAQVGPEERILGMTRRKIPFSSLGAVILEDISVRVGAEKELARLRDLFTDLWSQDALGLVWISRDGIIRSINPCASYWLGLLQEGRVVQPGMVMPLDLPETGGSRDVVLPGGEPMRMRTLGSEDGRHLLVVLQGAAREVRTAGELQSLRREVQGLFDRTSAVVLRIDPGGKRVLEANPAAAAYYGYSEEQFRGMAFSKLGMQGVPDLIREDGAAGEAPGAGTRGAAGSPGEDGSVESAERGSGFGTVRELHVDAFGEPRAVEVSYSRSVAGEEGETGFAVIHDLRSLTQAQERISEVLKDKKTLLRELYHRTKNNMQVIASMISLKRFTLDDPAMDGLLAELEGKIHSMALVHQKLYQSKSLSRLSLGEYLEDVAQLVIATLAGSGIRLEADCGDVEVLIDIATPLGLVLNELITNSIKYAFPKGGPGVISLEVAREDEGRCRIEVADSGWGMPGGFSLATHGGIGLQTVGKIVEGQLRGTLELRENNPGVRWVMTFYNTLYTERVYPQ